MPDATWKRWERKVAGILGGRRSGPLGHNVPDVFGARWAELAPECKLQGTLSLKTTDLEQAERNARGRPWALFLKKKGRTGPELVVQPLEYWQALYDRAYPPTTLEDTVV